VGRSLRFLPWKSRLCRSVGEKPSPEGSESAWSLEDLYGRASDPLLRTYSLMRRRCGERVERCIGCRERLGMHVLSAVATRLVEHEACAGPWSAYPIRAPANNILKARRREKSFCVNPLRRSISASAASALRSEASASAGPLGEPHRSCAPYGVLKEVQPRRRARSEPGLLRVDEQADHGDPVQQCYQRGGQGYPLDLLALLVPRTPVTQYQAEDGEDCMQRRNGGDRKYAASVTQGCAANANGLRTPPRFSNGSGVSPT
jgi:hypothetical protein